MNKHEFIDAVAAKTGLTQKDSKVAVDAFMEVVTEQLVKGETITFVGFGVFTTAQRAEREARVPGTDRKVIVPATKVAKFKVGKGLKTAVSAN